MTVGFYINNSQFPDLNCIGIEKGNPGIGGTWYVFMLVSQQLADRNNGIDVLIYLQVENKTITKSAKVRIVSGAWEAIASADNEQIDYLVLWNLQIEWERISDYFFNSNLRLIPLCENFCSLKDLDLFYQSSRIARIINVGREQMDLYRDHRAFQKMDFIYNCVPIKDDDIELARKHPYSSRGHVVTYLGSLVRSKYFHVLARLWPEIMKRVPDAELYVVGSGKVYNSNQKLGKHNIASEEYEQVFMPYLIDNEGNILSSVHFMGKMGVEKNEILLKTKVGAPNPTGDSETFCLSAVEMEALGAACVAMDAPGYYDTFINGYISKREKDYVNDIVKLLLADNPPVPFEDVVRAVKDKFSVESVIIDWERLFLSNMTTYLHPISPLTNEGYRLKRFKEFLRKLKNNHILPQSAPTIEHIYGFMNRVGLLLRRPSSGVM